MFNDIILKELKELKDNRLIKTDEEFRRFEEAREKLSLIEDENIIREICKAFDDNTEDEEVMFGLIHLIEKFNNKESLKQTALSIPDMMKNAHKWAKIIHYRIINDDVSRKQYRYIISELDIVTKNIIVDLLTEISNEDNEQFGKKVSDILI